MTVDASKTFGANQFWIWRMDGTRFGLSCPVVRGKAQVRQVYLISRSANAHQEIFWFNVSMNNLLGMDVFKAANKLICEQQHGFEGKPAPAKVEKVFQTWPEEIKDHRVVLALKSIPVNTGNANTSDGLVYLSFLSQQRRIGRDVFELDGDFFTSLDIDSFPCLLSLIDQPRSCFPPTKINDTETTATNLPLKTVSLTRAEILENNVIPYALERES